MLKGRSDVDNVATVSMSSPLGRAGKADVWVILHSNPLLTTSRDTSTDVIDGNYISALRTTSAEDSMARSIVFSSTYIVANGLPLGPSGLSYVDGFSSRDSESSANITMLDVGWARTLYISPNIGSPIRTLSPILSTADKSFVNVVPPEVKNAVSS